MNPRVVALYISEVRHRNVLTGQYVTNSQLIFGGQCGLSRTFHASEA